MYENMNRRQTLFPVVSMVETLVAIVVLEAETDGHSSTANPHSTRSAPIKKIVTLKVLKIHKYIS